MNGFRGRDDLLIGGIQSSVADILHDASREQVRILKHIAQTAVEPELAPLPVILSVDENLASCRLKEAAGQVYQRTFSGSGLADNGHIGSCRNLQIKVA